MQLREFPLPFFEAKHGLDRQSGVTWEQLCVSGSHSCCYPDIFISVAHIQLQRVGRKAKLCPMLKGGSEVLQTIQKDA